METKHSQNEVVISVIIPVYNVEQYLCECVDSVLSQTYQNFEIILVDDEATDKSGEICDQYALKDQRITVIHQKNGGLSAARNTGLANANGEYIYFLDSDDYIVSYALEHLIQIARDEDADIVFFDAEVFFTGCDSDPNVYRYERSREYSTLKGQQMLLQLLETDEYRTAVPLMLLRHSFLENNRIDFMVDILHEDELFTFLLYYANGIVAHCHEKLYWRRMRAASIMTASSMLKRYDSMSTIYFNLSSRYSRNEITGLVADRYMARITRSVLAKFICLDNDSKGIRQLEYKKFQRDVLRNHGYGDMKLKIKCSVGIRNIFYRIQNKIYTKLKLEKISNKGKK